ncbi:MAG: pirin family protein [Candidatus Hodarchaeales archaeon]|jgi:redox-sensitive bicupin YhaK (pirin superfamily)
MKNLRTIHSIIKSRTTMEGAGVRLKRAFAHEETKILDPFLLLDDFSSNNPDDYIAGFPWHPHRGIETVTYMIDGQVMHEDSIGNKGIISGGDIQWMTAGRGIVHQEMPQRTDGLLAGFQLWVNLPSKSKMMAPRYQEISAAEIPEFTLDSGVIIRIIAGRYNGTVGPVRDIVAEPEYFDITIPSNSLFEYQLKSNLTAFSYIFEGSGIFQSEKDVIAGNLVIFSTDGDMIKVETKETSVRFLLVSGKPINEPISWMGPIVMNTQEEVRKAFEEYRNGTFLK